MKIAFNDLSAQWNIIKKECLKEFDSLFQKSDFILGEKVKGFENNFSNYIGTKYATGTSNGTDALKLSAQSLNIEGSTCVLIPANTFIATILGVEQALPNAEFVLIDCDEYYQINTDEIECFLNEHRHLYTNIVIVPVHLYGYSCDMDRICQLSHDYDCIIIEDASQSHGTLWKNKCVGTFGDVSAFSLYPGKNLGAAGDAGIITTNDETIYNKLQKLRNFGSVKKHKHEIRGGNHRLDTIQAIILNQKIKYIESWNDQRRSIVKKYEENIINEKITLPKTPKGCLPTHHIYPIRTINRDGLAQYLHSNQIEYGIHYPVCIEEMDMYKHLYKPNDISIKYSKEMISIPIHPFMKEQEINYVIECLNKY